MLVFSSAEITKSPEPRGWPSQWPWYKSRIGPAFSVNRGSRGKIQVRMAPRADGVAAEPSPNRGATDIGDPSLLQHLPPDVFYGKPGQRQTQAVRQLTGEGFDADDETGGKSGP